MPQLVSEMIPAVIAIDPGLVSGVAVLADPHGEAIFSSFETEGGRFGMAQSYEAVTSIFRPELLVVEDFIISNATARKSAQPDPYRLVGWLEIEAHRHGIPFKLQTASTAKGFATNEKLRHLGWYRSSKGGHANDAARHLLTATRDFDPIQAKLLEFAREL